MLTAFLIVLLDSLTEDLMRIADEHVGNVFGQRFVNVSVDELLVNGFIVLKRNVVVANGARIDVAVCRIVPLKITYTKS